MKAEKITPQRHDPQGYTPQTEPVIMQMAKEVMEKVNPKDRVRVENGLHYIDGVPALRWGQWQDCTYAGPVAIICNLLGIPVSYEDIMGLCGACYRIAMEEHWDPSASMLQVGPNCENNPAAALGIDVYCLADEQERDKNVMRSIDKGVPVLACGQRHEPEWTLITGYEETEDGEGNRPKFFGRTYFDHQGASTEETYTANQYYYADRYPGCFPETLLRFYDRRCEPIPMKSALKVSLETAVRMFEEPSGQYMHGFDAYETLINGFSLDDEGYHKTCRNDQYYIGLLVDARRCASIFLQKYASLLTDENRDRLVLASELYKKMTDCLLNVLPYQLLPDKFNGNAEALLDRERRNKMVAALKKVMNMEKQVQSLIKDVLAHWE